MTLVERAVIAYREHRDAGFTVAEIAITIPIILILSTAVIYLMGNSVITVNNNNLSLEAAHTVQEILDDVDRAPTCNALDEMEGYTSYNSGEDNEYSVLVEVSHVTNPASDMSLEWMGYWEGCNNVGAVTTVDVTATSPDTDEGVLFRSSRTVMPSGGITGGTS